MAWVDCYEKLYEVLFRTAHGQAALRGLMDGLGCCEDHG
jgi:hypothetical protein